MKYPRLAALDIGTNSIRCIVAEIYQPGKYRIVDDEKATVRIGEGIARTNVISPLAWQRALSELARMKKIVDGYGVEGIEIVATSAVRRAENGAAFVAAVADSVGLEISVISGEEEAELAAASAIHNFQMDGIRFAMIDIGGGSVEIATAYGNHIDLTQSLDLGAVVLTERFISSDPVNDREYTKMRKHIRKVLREAFAGEEMTLQCMVGSGGTMTSIAAMVMALRREAYQSVHGYEILRSEVVHLLAMLLRKDLKERKTIQGLNPDRADIIIAGVTVIDELMDIFHVNQLKINERGIREGLILKGLKKRNLVPAESKIRTWRESVLEFARSCHYEEVHSHQVADLALAIFEAVTARYGFNNREKQMLEAAALLHDIGYFISYSAHHKHTYHLIRHAELFDFTPREIELTAQIARYHRKSIPKKKHEAFSRLSIQDQLLVSRLGGIMRLADGLDRRRNSQVSGIACSDSESSFTVRLQGQEDLSVEIFGGKTKSDLFELAFKKKVIVISANDSSTC